MRSRYGAALAALLLVAGGVLAACGGQSSGASDKPKKTNIIIRTDYLFNGYIAPYALAIENGYFKDEGIKVDLEQGQGSATTVQTVASGKDDFGIADSGTVAKAITNQDVPVKVIDVHLQKTPIGFIYKPEDKVTTAASVAKRVIISSPGAGELALLPAVTAKAGIPSSKLNSVGEHPRAYPQVALH